MIKNLLCTFAEIGLDIRKSQEIIKSLLHSYESYKCLAQLDKSSARQREIDFRTMVEPNQLRLLAAFIGAFEQFNDPFIVFGRSVST